MPSGRAEAHARSSAPLRTAGCETISSEKRPVATGKKRERASRSRVKKIERERKCLPVPRCPKARAEFLRQATCSARPGAGGGARRRRRAARGRGGACLPAGAGPRAGERPARARCADCFAELLSPPRAVFRFAREKPGFHTIDLKINLVPLKVVPTFIGFAKRSGLGRRRGLILIVFARVPRRYLVLEP